MERFKTAILNVTRTDGSKCKERLSADEIVIFYKLLIAYRRNNRTGADRDCFSLNELNEAAEVVHVVSQYDDRLPFEK